MPRVARGTHAVRRRRFVVGIVACGLASSAMPMTAFAASPAATLSTVAFTTVEVSKAPGVNAVDITSTMTTDGNAFAFEPVSLWVASPAAPTFTQYDATTSASDGTVSFVVDGSLTSSAVFAEGPITFELRHGPTATESAALRDAAPWAPPKTTLTINAPHTVDYGHEMKVTGALTYAGGAGVPTSSLLALQARAKGATTWTSIDSGSVGQLGRLVFRIDSRPHNGDLRIVFVSDSPGAASAVSDIAAVEVRPDVALVVSPDAVPPGAKAHVSVTVEPKVSAGEVTLQRNTRKGWRVVGKGGLATDSQRSWPVKVRHKVGVTSYRVLRAPTALNVAGRSATKRLTVERHAGGRARDHAFLYELNGKPVRWNPCRAIHYRVNLDEAPGGALADVKETLRRISQPTRLRFIDDGHTHYIPGSSGSQTSQLVIAWARPTETSLPLGAGTLGEGGGTYTYGAGQQPHIATGYAVLDSTASLTPGFGAGQTEGALLMHELGHAVGLDHAKHPSQIMFPFLGPHPATMYGAGDYRGLQLLGRSQGCLS